MWWQKDSGTTRQIRGSSASLGFLAGLQLLSQTRPVMRVECCCHCCGLGLTLWTCASVSHACQPQRPTANLAMVSRFGAPAVVLTRPSDNAIASSLSRADATLSRTLLTVPDSRFFGSSACSPPACGCLVSSSCFAIASRHPRSHDLVGLLEPIREVLAALRLVVSTRRRYRSSWKLAERGQPERPSCVDF